MLEVDIYEGGLSMMRVLPLFWFIANTTYAFWLWFSGEIGDHVSIALLALIIGAEIIMMAYPRAARVQTLLRKTRYMTLSLALVAYSLFPIFPDVREFAPLFLLIAAIFPYVALLIFFEERHANRQRLPM